MFCSNCGNQIEDGALFCPNCGKAMEETQKAKTDNNVMRLIKTMVKNPVAGFSEIYQSDNMKLPVIIVAAQLVLAVIYGFLLDSKLVNAYNNYIGNMSMNLTNGITSVFGDFLGSLAGIGGGRGAGLASELVEGIFGGSIDAAAISIMQLKSNLIGIGAILITVVVAIVAQISILFLLMLAFKMEVAFMDAVKVYAAKSYWSAVCILISIILILFSPWVAIAFVLISGIFVNHTIGQMLQNNYVENQNQIFWMQLIFNIIEIATIALSVYYIVGVVGDNFISYIGGILPALGNIF